MKTFRFSKQLKKLKAAKTVSDINHFFIFFKKLLQSHLRFKFLDGVAAQDKGSIDV